MFIHRNTYNNNWRTKRSKITSRSSIPDSSFQFPSWWKNVFFSHLWELVDNNCSSLIQTTEIIMRSSRSRTELNVKHIHNINKQTKNCLLLNEENDGYKWWPKNKSECLYYFKFRQFLIATSVQRSFLHKNYVTWDLNAVQCRKYIILEFHGIMVTQSSTLMEIIGLRKQIKELFFKLWIHDLIYSYTWSIFSTMLGEILFFE